MSFHHVSATSHKLLLSKAQEPGKYGWLFKDCAPCQEITDIEIDKLKALAQSMFGSKGFSKTPAGFTYLGQFIIHDLSFDSTSLKERELDINQIENFRTPALDLDSIYGSGPMGNPFLYNQAENDGRTHFLLTKRRIERDITYFDIPRNTQGIGILADPRNDENLLISQLHVLFLLFHNKIADQLKSAHPNLTPEALFKQTQRQVRHHYQSIILHDYLPKLIDSQLLIKLAESRENLAFFKWDKQAFIPLEFSAAAFRFGHTQVGMRYKFNAHSALEELPIFDYKRMQQSKENIPYRIPVNWRFFFGKTYKNLNLEISPFLRKELKHIPPFAVDEENNLACRNLLRGLMFGLPSGQAVANAMGISPILNISHLQQYGLENNTPLWYYILYEAKELAKGVKLGPVGERIVAEVIIGLLHADTTSLLHLPNWKNWTSPLYKTVNQGFTMEDLLNFIEK